MRALTYALVSERRPVVVAVPNEEILEQMIADVHRETRTPFYVEKAERKRPATSRITLVSHASLWRRLENHPTKTVLRKPSVVLNCTLVKAAADRTRSC